ncbi:hypothetical protein BGZ61DRAFT_586247 [Ilyonectria robusta]|uniref:uncharacterized protein n=1 Tax=Ilyonectria robusta TaxID=1079257 RepID=UPI001E8CA4AF|nr:uncharacterized protein BGZ61DRAFT_586247 [Ilyonectria robusta]KAH8729725.1 hypothetical protein BGZ61DRAFT_586247 [Ilyonectria robusta]
MLKDDYVKILLCWFTLPPSPKSSTDTWRLALYPWTHQHTHLFPSTCFVLDDGSGTEAGYCIDCPSVDALIAAYALHVTAVLDASPEVHPRSDPLKPPEPWTSAEGSVNAASLAQLAYDPHQLAPVAHTDVPPRFRTTLHIDLLEPWQAKGWGGKLLERLVGARGAV